MLKIYYKSSLRCPSNVKGAPSFPLGRGILLDYQQYRPEERVVWVR